MISCVCVCVCVCVHVRWLRCVCMSVSVSVSVCECVNVYVYVCLGAIKYINEVTFHISFLFNILYKVNTIATALFSKMMYTRNYTGHKSLLADPTMLKQWQDVFSTRDKGEVEAELRRTSQEFSWKGDNLKIVGRETSVETHPVTGEKIWFNHSGVSRLTEFLLSLSFSLSQ